MEWELQQQTFEIRYKRGYLHWDRAGLTANEVVTRFPTYTVENSSPAEVSFLERDDQYTFSYGTDSASVTAVAGKPSMDEIASTARELLAIAIRNFELTAITRTGHRIIHHLVMDSEENAKNHFQRIVKQHDAGFSFLSAANDPRLAGKNLKDFTLRFEDEKTGVRISAQVFKTTLNLAGPQIHLVASHMAPSRWVLATDIDLYTAQPISPSDLFIDVLMKSNMKMLKTRILPLFE